MENINTGIGNIVTVNGKRYRVIFEEIKDEHLKRLLSIKEVCSIYGIPRTKIYNMIRTHAFPEGAVVKMEGRATKFNAEIVNDFFVNKY